MAEKDKKFEEKDNLPKDSSIDVTELDDQDLEGAAGGFDDDAGSFAVPTNENCSVC
jgi:hypothetical protein